MDKQTITKGEIAPCCMEPNYRRVISSSTAKDGTVRSVEQCSACGRKHYMMSVPAVEFGVSGASIG